MICRKEFLNCNLSLVICVKTVAFLPLYKLPSENQQDLSTITRALAEIYSQEKKLPERA